MPSIDPINGSLKTINRLSMISVDSKKEIIFFPDRIDCNYSSGDEKIEPSALETILKDMCHLMECTAEYFPII